MPEARRRAARSSKSLSNTEVKITKRSQSSHDEDRDRHHESRRREREQEHEPQLQTHEVEPTDSLVVDVSGDHQAQEQVTYFNDDTKQLLNIPNEQHENADEIMNEEYDDGEHDDYESDAESEEYEEEEYDELDLTGERLYDILSPFLETDDGEGVADVLLGIRESLDEHTEAIRELTETLRDYFNRRSTAVPRSFKSSSRQ